MALNIENWKNQLLTSRMLFYHAEEHRSPPTHLNRILAVIGYHSAIEIALKAIADKRDIQPRKKDFTVIELLNAVIKDVPDAMSKQIRVVDIQKIASIRNLAIHQGTVPSEESILEARQCARQFLITSVKSFFRLDFENLDAADLIQSEKARNLLKIARENLTSDSYFDSRVPAKLAFQMFFNNYLKMMPKGIHFRAYSAVANIETNTSSELTQNEREIVKAIDRLYSAVSDEIEETRAVFGLASLGYGMDQLQKYEMVSSTISFRIGAVSMPTSSGTRNTPETVELSEWFLRFITDAILRFESFNISEEPLDYLEPWYKHAIEKRGKIFS